MQVIEFIKAKLKNSKKESKESHETALILSKPFTITNPKKTIDITPKAYRNHPLLNIYPVLAAQMATFLEPEDVSNLLSASKGTLTLYQKPLNDKKPLEPLRQVLKANPKKSISALESLGPEYGCVVLKRVNGKQAYFSKKFKTTVTLDEWNNTSPLEASAHCLDNFIVNELIKRIPNNSKLLEEAIAQLQGVLDSQESEKEANEKLKTPAKRIYQAPYKNLIKAYKTFNDQVVVQRGLHGDDYDNWDWSPLNKLWNEVWEAQRKLPTYGLQEFCDKKTFDPLPPIEKSFKEEPTRTCKLFNGVDVDLDGLGENLALYKAWRRGCVGAGGSSLVVRVGWAVGVDSAAFDRLCKVRNEELKNIIELLKIRLQTALLKEQNLSSTDNLSRSSKSR